MLTVRFSEETPQAHLTTNRKTYLCLGSIRLVSHFIRFNDDVMCLHHSAFEGLLICDQLLLKFGALDKLLFPDGHVNSTSRGFHCDFPTVIVLAHQAPTLFFSHTKRPLQIVNVVQVQIAKEIIEGNQQRIHRVFIVLARG